LQDFQDTQTVRGDYPSHQERRCGCHIPPKKSC
jgi:hypothetical protein